MKWWILLPLFLVACAHVNTARETQADTYRMRIAEVTDRLSPMRQRITDLCHQEDLPDPVYEWCGLVENAFDIISDSQRIAWTAVAAYEAGALANDAVENALAALKAAENGLRDLGDQPPETLPPPPP